MMTLIKVIGTIALIVIGIAVILGFISIAAVIGGIVILAAIGGIFIVLFIIAMKDVWDMWSNRRHRK